MSRIETETKRIPIEETTLNQGETRMKINRTIMAAACGFLVAVTPFVGSAQTADANLYSKIIQSGSLDQIQKAADEALKQNPKDEKLKKLAAEIKKNAQREKAVVQESNPEVLDKLARPLRLFYLRAKLYNEAEKLDRLVFEKKPDNVSAIRLAETYLTEKKNREAADLLASRTLTEQDSLAKLYAALAHARLGDTENAKKYLGQVTFDKLTPRELLNSVQVNAALGDAAAAAAGVKKIIENAPAKETKMLRKYFQSEDFVKVSSSEAYKAALTAEGKQTDSCAGCPNKGTANCGGGDCD